MDLENSLRKIKTQLKFGRIIGIEKSLHSLLSDYTGTAYEIEVLEVFTLNFLKTVGDYEAAIPLLNRLLLLDISTELRKDANNFLDICNENVEIAPSKPDATNSDFVDFTILVRSKEFLALLHYRYKEKITLLSVTLIKQRKPHGIKVSKNLSNLGIPLERKQPNKSIRIILKTKLTWTSSTIQFPLRSQASLKKTSPLISWNFTTTFMAI